MNNQLVYKRLKYLTIRIPMHMPRCHKMSWILFQYCWGNIHTAMFSHATEFVLLFAGHTCESTLHNTAIFCTPHFIFVYRYLSWCTWHSFMFHACPLTHFAILRSEDGKDYESVHAEFTCKELSHNVQPNNFECLKSVFLGKIKVIYWLDTMKKKSI